MRAKLLAILTIAVIAGAYHAHGRQRSAYPQDLRDAVGSGTAYDSLSNSSSGGDIPVPSPSPAVPSRRPAPKTWNAPSADRCGPDISIPLAATLEKIARAYNSWTPELRKQNCAVMDVDAKLNAIDGWDIEDIRPDLGYPSVIKADIVKTGGCAKTLAVDGKCYRNEEINYVMWGEMARLCGKSLRWSNFKIRAYITYYYTLYPPRRQEENDSYYSGEISNKIAWSESGFYGWPNAASPAATRPDCVPSRSAPYGNSIAFSTHWGNTDIK